MINVTHNLLSAYRFYRKKLKSTDHKIIDRMTYKRVCSDYNKAFAENAYSDPNGSLVPFGLGSIKIRKFPINWEKPPIDMQASVKAGKTVYHLNRETGGYCFRWHWEKKNRAFIRNIIYYSFKPMYDVRKASVKHIKKVGHTKYFTQDDIRIR